MEDYAVQRACISLNQSRPETRDPPPSEVMPTHLLQLLKYDVHRNTFLDTASSAEEGLLKLLKLLEKANAS